MRVIQKQSRKIVVRHTAVWLLQAVFCCWGLATVFWLLDAKHPKAALNCIRHAVLPDNDLEVVEGNHVEDVDCVLEVRPTRSALDVYNIHEEVIYSFEITAARLEPVQEKDAQRMCALYCTVRGCFCRKPSDSSSAPNQTAAGGGSAESPHRTDQWPSSGAAVGRVRQGVHYNNHIHPKASDVASLVLVDNQGDSYTFYTFDSMETARRMFLTVDRFIKEARLKNAHSHRGGQPSKPLHLEVLYDDSWFDECACTLFLLLGLALVLWRPCAETATFDAEAGVMLLERRTALRWGVLQYSCALENVSRVEVTQTQVLVMSVAAEGEGQRQDRKEHGLRVLFSGPMPPTTAARGWGSGARAGDLINHLDLAFGRKFADDAQLRRVAELVNDLLQKYASDAETPSPSADGHGPNRTCCICLRRSAKVVSRVYIVQYTLAKRQSWAGTTAIICAILIGLLCGFQCWWGPERQYSAPERGGSQVRKTQIETLTASQ